MSSPGVPDGPVDSHDLAGFAAPRYGAASLSDVGPSALAALEAGGRDVLGLAPTPRVVVLLVDGLGWLSLQEHAACAPFLTSLSADVLTVGFPTTTATSLSSLGTGLPPGEHGVTGYSSWVPEVGDVVSWLGWRRSGHAEDLRETLVPEDTQPRATVWEQAAQAGVEVTVVDAGRFEGTGLTRAVFRGGRFVGVHTPGDAVAAAAYAADRGHRSLTYVYIASLDLVGHVRGAGTPAWLAELALVDRQAELLAASLPAGTTLLVTADHGMARLDPDVSTDADAPGSPLREGVVALAGEARMRHVHVRSGARDDVLATWRSVLGDAFAVVTGDDAVAAGWFGPVVTRTARGRIGDVLAVSRGDGGVVQRRRESRSSALLGHHGSLTDIELLVPLLRHQS